MRIMTFSRRAIGTGLLCLGLLQASAGAATAPLATLLQQQDYKAAEPQIRPLLAKRQAKEPERALIYGWLFAHDDMPELDRRSRQGSASVDLQAAGRLALETRDFERARQSFQGALEMAGRPADRAAALKGLGQVEYQLRHFDASLVQLEASLKAFPSADAYAALNETLIRLGRTDEAITAAQRAVELNPWQELAHYQLGNGYTRKNYT